MALVWGPTGITGESGEIWGMVEAPTPAPAPAAPTFSPLVSAFLQLLTPGKLASDQVWSPDVQSLVDGPSVWHAATYTATSGAAKGSTLTDDLGAYVTNNDGTHALEGGTSGIVATDQAGYDAYQSSLAKKLGLDPSAHYLLGSQSLAGGINESDVYRVDSTGLTRVASNQWKPQSSWVSFWRPALEGSAAVVGASFGLAAAAGAIGAGAATAAVDAAPATLTDGAFLGENVASGVGAWDAAATSAGLTLTTPAAALATAPTLTDGAFLGENVASGVPTWDAAASSAGLTLTTPAAALPSVDSSIASSLTSAASSTAAPASSSALPTLGQAAGAASSLVGLAKQIGILPTPSSPSAAQLAAANQAHTAASQRGALLLVGALVAGALLLRKKGAL
jgi:hypothetical protein